jgi:hypothetical protein
LIEVGAGNRFWELFGTQSANKTQTHTPQPHNPTTQHATWFGIGPRDHATQQATIPTNPQTDGYKKPGPAECALALSAAPSGGTACQIPTSSSDKLKTPNLKFQT